ncbi:OmpA family protein [Aquabacterium sp.]|uniref:OmpA family protein n=1 Tax=Aquabacterium sp. TaxID=1872578 RepID=UPI002C3E0B7C|nr:OmpA family protein [Aquabacterium sp.]HSW07600.1 OmpA family protein [Aquabacterium sp.]
MPSNRITPFIRSRALIGAAMLVLAGVPAQATDFGQRTPEVKELVDALKPPERTRGIAIVGASSATRTKASMQVGFDFGSATVIPRDVVKLDRLADALKSESLREYRYQVVGHTDAVGPLALNMKLSRDRAGAVVAYLMQQGIPAERLTADGKGPKELLDTQRPDAAENRRVEVRLVQ